jgi:excinuclease ABC subunit C
LPAVKRALAILPHEPGVYILRERSGRIIYVGRSRDLASRARSYWSDLRDRPHLVRMVQRVEWLEPVVCASEHEAAFLESDLLERHRTRYNRTLGMESCVWLRLDTSPHAPTLDVVHEPCPHDGASWFGPYLGWEPARQAAAGLLRLYPLRYSGSHLSRTDREMARSLGVSEADAPLLARRIERVLNRYRSEVRAAIRGLEEMRDRAAGSLMFEHAEQLQQQIRGLLWIVEPQKLATLDPVDRDFCAAAGTGDAAVLVILALRGGRMAQRHVHRIAQTEAWPAGAEAAHDGPWVDLARRNAELMARLAAADAIGPLGWRT